MWLQDKIGKSTWSTNGKRLQNYYVLCAPDWITCECGNIHNPSLKATDFFTHEPAQAAGTASAHTETSSLADQDANSASTQLTAYPLHHKDHSTFPQKKKRSFDELGSESKASDRSSRTNNQIHKALLINMLEEPTMRVTRARLHECTI